MNFNALSNQTMLSHSDEWLNTPATRALLSNYELTAALLPELQGAYDELADKQALRARIYAQLGLITESLSGHDRVHDRKARGMFSILNGLAESSDDPAQVTTFLDLLARLYPQGLQVINRSYIDEAGAVVEMQRQVTDEMLTFMASVRVGSQTLADIYTSWVAAGMALGREARERARLQQAMTKEGTAAADMDTRAPRQRWIRVVNALVTILDMLLVPEQERERLLAPLMRSIQDATRNRGGADDLLDDDPSGELPGGGDTVEDGDEEESTASGASAEAALSTAASGPAPAAALADDSAR